jgi:hypothetical protein
VKRFAIFALLAPPLGMAVGMYVMLPLLNGGFVASTLDWHNIVLLPAAYVIGLIPAMIVGLFDRALAKRLVRRRVLWTAGFAFAASFIPLLPSVAMGFIQTPWILPFGLIGAVPGALCSWLAGPAGKPAA